MMLSLMKWGELNMAKKKFTMEDNYEEVKDKIINNTNYAKAQIGRALVREIRPEVNRQKNIPRRMFLRATLQSWARNKEGDIIIGFKNPKKISYLRNKDIDYDSLKWKYDTVADPIKPVVIKNIKMMQQLIGESIAHKANRGRDESIFKQKDIEP